MADTSKQSGTPAASGPDLEKVPVEQVLAKLAVNPEQGLSAAEAQQRVAKYGPNAIIEKEKSLGEQILGYFSGSMAYVIEAAALMCGFGWLVPAIPWKLIGWVWVYLIAWLFVLGSARLIYDRFASYRTARHLKHAALVNQSLQPHIPAA
ncbi:MAG: hypothetical protein KBE22_15980 [Candidatus Accumulibacter sp.]|nr:hypothetical protein [Accumulibacter sp.]